MTDATTKELREQAWRAAAEIIQPGAADNFPAAAPSGLVYLALGTRIREAIEAVYADIGATTEASVLASNAATFLDEAVREIAFSAHTAARRAGMEEAEAIAKTYPIPFNSVAQHPVRQGIAEAIHAAIDQEKQS